MAMKEQRRNLFLHSYNHPYYSNELQFLHSREYDVLTPSEVSEREFQANPIFINNLFISRKLKRHKGCVNTVKWNEEGTLLISGSDDCNLCIWSGETYQLLSCIDSGHSNNIFGAQFIPYSNDKKILSSGADGEIRITDIDYDYTPTTLNVSYDEKRTNVLQTYYHIIMKFEFLPCTPQAVLTSHQDGTVRLLDTRTSETDEVVVNIKHGPCYGISFNPLSPSIFAVSGSDYFVRLYDIRKPCRPYRNSTSSHCLQKFHPQGMYYLHPLPLSPSLLSLLIHTSPLLLYNQFYHRQSSPPLLLLL